MRSSSLILFFLVNLNSAITHCQSDTLPYSLFNKQWVVYSDLGFTSAPFSVSYPFSKEISKLRYRNNYRTILGIGASYKWFALRIGIPLPGYTRPIAKFGQTSPFNIGFDFTFKKVYCDIDLRYFKGYVIENAYLWNDSLSTSHPNDIRSSTAVSSFSTNVWYFNHKDFKMSALKGKTGHYNQKVHTWYLKNTFNVFGVSNDKISIIPAELSDLKKPQTQGAYYSAADIGIIPGYAYVDRIKNWQFSLMGGLGGVVQAKFYGGTVSTRGFLGLAPRYDIRLLGGYSVPNYFVFLLTDFDNKSIRFGELVYRQNFYSIKIVAGKRFPVRTKKAK